MDSVHKEALHDRLMAMRPGRIEPGLARVRRVAEALAIDLGGRSTRWVLVAGTNGKGSTVSFLTAILEAAGHRVGRYTSPHLVDVSERIQVNSEVIAPGAFTRHGVAVLASAEECGVELTYFEVVTLVALLEFQSASVDIGVLEVGLGGRLDATNIVHPAASVITTIGMDHMEFLGDSLASIAWEKGGGTRPDAPLVSGLCDELHAASLQGRETPSLVRRIERDFAIRSEGGSLTYGSSTGERKGLVLSLEGAHQRHNASLAIACAELLVPALAAEEVRAGLSNAELPGRNEWVRRTDGPDLLLDGAHNPAAAQALRTTLDGLPAEKRLVGLLASRAGKDPGHFADIVGGRVREWFATTAPGTPRMMTAQEVHASLAAAGRASSGAWEDPLEALSQA